MENWESEFLQMGVFVFFTAFLYQKGSAESKDPEKREEVDRDPRKVRDKKNAPWPVRRGGWVLALYENSLTLAFLVLFLTSFVLHAVGGRVESDGAGFARGRAGFAGRLYGIEPLLVRIFPELAERIFGDRLHGAFHHSLAAERVSRIEASRRAPFPNREVTV